ncbi:hypothetical protein H5410_021049 [Solanum commersonii]|uniref:Uncharacterized protein n=1 Tax=Solanum commersonii TaxID=4109 RepID=A0A9J5ZD45_SOLCO|nr:hypothetical protein H5410_021049 [Solanum commersonii]
MGWTESENQCELVAMMWWNLEGDVSDFKIFVETENMFEIRCLGRRYTWSNGNIHSKIDLFLINSIWVQ